MGSFRGWVELCRVGPGRLGGAVLPWAGCARVAMGCRCIPRVGPDRLGFVAIVLASLGGFVGSCAGFFRRVGSGLVGCVGLDCDALSWGGVV